MHRAHTVSSTPPPPCNLDTSVKINTFAHCAMWRRMRQNKAVLGFGVFCAAMLCKIMKKHQPTTLENNMSANRERANQWLRTRLQTNVIGNDRSDNLEVQPNASCGTVHALRRFLWYSVKTKTLEKGEQHQRLFVLLLMLLLLLLGKHMNMCARQAHTPFPHICAHLHMYTETSQAECEKRAHQKCSTSEYLCIASTWMVDPMIRKIYRQEDSYRVETLLSTIVAVTSGMNPPQREMQTCERVARWCVDGRIAFPEMRTDPTPQMTTPNSTPLKTKKLTAPFQFGRKAAKN